MSDQGQEGGGRCKGRREEWGTGNKREEGGEEKAGGGKSKESGQDGIENIAGLAGIADLKSPADSEEDNGDDKEEELDRCEDCRIHGNADHIEERRRIARKAEQDIPNPLDREDGDVNGDDDLDGFVLAHDKAVGGDDGKEDDNEEIPSEGKFHEGIMPQGRPLSQMAYMPWLLIPGT